MQDEPTHTGLKQGLSLKTSEKSYQLSAYTFDNQLDS